MQRTGRKSGSSLNKILIGASIAVVVLLGALAAGALSLQGVLDREATTYREAINKYVRSVGSTSEEIHANYMTAPKLQNLPLSFLSSSYDAALKQRAIVEENTKYLKQYYDAMEFKPGLLSYDMYNAYTTYWKKSLSAENESRAQLTDAIKRGDDAAYGRVISEQYEQQMIALREFRDAITAESKPMALHVYAFNQMLTAITAYEASLKSLLAEAEKNPDGSIESLSGKMVAHHMKRDEVKRYFEYISYYPGAFFKLSFDRVIVKRMAVQIQNASKFTTPDEAALYAYIDSRVAVTRTITPLSTQDEAVYIKPSISRVVIEEIIAEAKRVHLAPDSAVLTGLERLRATLSLYGNPTESGENRGYFIARVYEALKINTDAYEDTGSYVKTHRPVLEGLKELQVDAPVYIQADYAKLINEYESAMPLFQKADAASKKMNEALAHETQEKDVEAKRYWKDATDYHDKAQQQVQRAYGQLEVIEGKVGDVKSLSRTYLSQSDQLQQTLVH